MLTLVMTVSAEVAIVRVGGLGIPFLWIGVEEDRIRIRTTEMKSWSEVGSRQRPEVSAAKMSAAIHMMTTEGRRRGIVNTNGPMRRVGVEVMAGEERARAARLTHRLHRPLGPHRC